jgi:hypothetical protein
MVHLLWKYFLKVVNILNYTVNLLSLRSPSMPILSRRVHDMIRCPPIDYYNIKHVYQTRDVLCMWNIFSVKIRVHRRYMKHIVRYVLQYRYSLSWGLRNILHPFHLISLPCDFDQCHREVAPALHFYITWDEIMYFEDKSNIDTSIDFDSC